MLSGRGDEIFGGVGDFWGGFEEGIFVGMKGGGRVVLGKDGGKKGVFWGGQKESEGWFWGGEIDSKGGGV